MKLDGRSDEVFSVQIPQKKFHRAKPLAADESRVTHDELDGVVGMSLVKMKYGTRPGFKLTVDLGKSDEWRGVMSTIAAADVADLDAKIKKEEEALPSQEEIVQRRRDALAREQEKLDAIRKRIADMQAHRETKRARIIDE